MFWNGMYAIGEYLTKLSNKHVENNKNQNSSYAKRGKRWYTQGDERESNGKGGDYMGKYTAMQIANWILARNQMSIAEMGGEPISNLKLQKLLYYAQGTYMGITGNPLFDDPIVAWKHGPVVESVYHEYKTFGSNGIEQDGYSLPKFDAETENILEQAYEVFGQYSAWKLREMTHRELPWTTTEQSETISPDKIKKYFVEHYIVE